MNYLTLLNAFVKNIKSHDANLLNVEKLSYNLD